MRGSTLTIQRGVNDGICSDRMAAKEKRQLVLVTTVDIGGGLMDQIELYMGDIPEVNCLYGT